MLAVTGTPLPDLIRAFEENILENRGSLSDRIRHSKVRDQLKEQKDKAIPAIQAHLKEHRGSRNPDVLHAWNLILGWLQPGTAGHSLATYIVEEVPPQADHGIVP